MARKQTKSSMPGLRLEVTSNAAPRGFYPPTRCTPETKKACVRVIWKLPTMRNAVGVGKEEPHANITSTFAPASIGRPAMGAGSRSGARGFRVGKECRTEKSSRLRAPTSHGCHR